jgi:hypothetical protein
MIPSWEPGIISFGIFTLWSQYVPPRLWYLSVSFFLSFSIPEERSHTVLTYFLSKSPTKGLRKVVHQNGCPCFEIKASEEGTRQMRTGTADISADCRPCAKLCHCCFQLVTLPNLFYSFGNCGLFLRMWCPCASVIIIIIICYLDNYLIFVLILYI